MKTEPFDLKKALANPGRVVHVTGDKAKHIAHWPDGPEDSRLVVWWSDGQVLAYSEDGSSAHNKNKVVFLTPEPTQTPWEMADVPAVCWLRWLLGGKCYLVTRVEPEGIRCEDVLYTFHYMIADSVQFSTDLKTWRPCTKEALHENQP